MISTQYQLNPVPFTEEYRPDLLGGVTVIHGISLAMDEAGWQDELYQEETPTERGKGCGNPRCSLLRLAACPK